MKNKGFFLYFVLCTCADVILITCTRLSVQVVPRNVGEGTDSQEPELQVILSVPEELGTQLSSASATSTLTHCLLPIGCSGVIVSASFMLPTTVV